jgi:predicted ATP-dependent endonuclease of OLD family
MRIHALSVSNFRSIREAHLEECGQLNVLIGKNNSGKSNMLAALKTFFEFFGPRPTIATNRPAISAETDWYARDTSQLVKITTTLQLSDAELDELKNSISDEAPQVRTALFSRELDGLVSLELSFKFAPSNIGFVSAIAFGNTCSLEENLIFVMSTGSAEEVAQRVADLEGNRTAARIFGNVAARIDSEGWRRLVDRYPTPTFLRNITGVSNFDDSVVEELISLARASDSVADFQESCRARRTNALSQSEALSSAHFENSVSTFSGEAVTIPRYVEQFIGQVAALAVHHLSEQRQPIGDSEATRILNLKTSRGKGDVLKEIQAVVSSLLGVQIDAFTADTPSLRATRNRIPAELDVDDFLVQVNGSGIREALRLILDREFEKPVVLTVEEPEVHLHPALETAIMQYLKAVSAETQIFLSTHSTSFLDIGSLENVYLIRRDEETHVQRLNVLEAEEAIPQELGLRLSSLFMYERLVFVEGPTDEQVFRTLAGKLGVSFGQASLGFVTTGGARNFTHYATAATLSFLKKRNVKLTFVLDRDERDTQDLANLRSKLEDDGDLKVLRRRELENYLLQPETLARYILQRSEGRHAPTSEEIRAAIDEVCDELREMTVERRILKHICKPVIPDRQRIIKRGDRDFDSAVQEQLQLARTRLEELEAELKELTRETSLELSAVWSDHKQDVVPGDEILDRLFKRFGMRFNKRHEGPNIAREMRESEMPRELAELIRGLVA